MKWYKHMSDMLDDTRIRRLIKKHGAKGYAIYNAILERIVRRLDSDSPLPDLEETSEDIADILRDDTATVQDVTWYCIEQGLLSQDEITGRIVAHKIYKFLEAGATRSEEVKRMIKAYKEGVSDSLGQSRTVSDNLRLSELEENRIDKTREESKSHQSQAKAREDIPAYAIELAKRLYDRHLSTDDAFLAGKSPSQLRATFERWAADIEKLHRIDRREIEHIEAVIDWCQRPGSFWAPNILSGKKLREKFPMLVAQMRQERDRTQRSEDSTELPDYIRKALEANS